MRRGVRVRYQLVGLTLVALAPAISAWLANTASGRAWALLLDGTVSDRPGVWRLMRGGLAFVVIPTLALVLVLMLLYLYRRRSLRSVFVLGAIALLANFTAQFVKHTPFGLGEAWSSLNPLSGHVAVVAGIGLGWLVVAPARWRFVSTLATLVAVGCVSAGVMLAGWHTPFQVLCPLLISTAWALGCAPYSDRNVEVRRTDEPARARPWTELVLVVAGVGILAVVAVLVQHGSGDHPASVWSISLALAGAVGASSTAVGVVAHASRAIGLEPVSACGRNQRQVQRNRPSDDAVLGH
jgi:hypothetical protein